jgi:putative flavoprotein involved in K+ transport
MQRLETLIIGGGQAGLTMSHRLSQRGCPHLVLERGRIAERWRSERWHGLRFQFPNWSVKLPDFPFPHSDADEFATSAEIADFLEGYAAHVKCPVRCGIGVTALRRDDSGEAYLALTSAGSIAARNVVIATGPYQRPLVPDLLENPDLAQLHANAYKAPEHLPTGAVLIVGSGASGAQIAEELVRAGRKVYLSVGRHKRMPRRYRGHDLIWWLTEMGRGSTLEFADDLGQSLAYGDAAYHAFLDSVDAHIKEKGMELALEPAARMGLPDPPCLTAPIRQLDIRRAQLGSLIWATGYTFDFSWIDLPVLNVKGYPRHERGVAPLPGLYFLGLPWLTKMNSSFLSGVGDDAAQLANHIETAMRTSP